MPKDEWIREALTDDTVVVELLLRLRQSASEPPFNKPSLSPSLPPQRWGLRHPRSKSVTVMRKDYSTSTTTASTSATRCSPTTPLSWSGGSASPSGDSTRHPSDPSFSVRSKGSLDYEISQICSTNRRSQRKKKFEELKEKESLLLKERVQLRRDLASMNTTLGEQKDRSHNLKRMKFDLNFRSTKESGITKEAPKEAQKAGFVLPDLNMTPFEEDIGSEYG
ncbi:hypothetical protein ACJIZ3_023154 [Penstemon smallii]|uniref:Uncharacterized protein n=1 Tax=Penstemon smallii TaxID=265156 RepID=A0ABD3TR82_9LAMI